MYYYILYTYLLFNNLCVHIKRVYKLRETIVLCSRDTRDKIYTSLDSDDLNLTFEL